MQRSITLVAALTVLSQIVGAQDRPVGLRSVRPGTPMKVWSTDSLLQGAKRRFQSATRDTITFASGPMGLSSVRRLEVADGRVRTPGYFVKTTAIGAGIGWATGAIVGFAIDQGYPAHARESAAVLSYLGMLGGGVVGFGFGFRGGVVWSPVWLSDRSRGVQSDGITNEL